MSRLNTAEELPMQNEMIYFQNGCSIDLLWSKTSLQESLSVSDALAASISLKENLILDRKLVSDAGKFKESVRDILLTYFRDMEVPFIRPIFDDGFVKACCDDATRYGFKKEILESADFQLALKGAAAIAMTCYDHLQNKSTQRWTCLYTACLIYFDDLTQTDASSVRDFAVLFITGKPQKHPLLDNFVTLLRGVRDHFNSSGADIVLSCTLEFITGLILDYDHQKMVVHNSAANYPRYFRTMMGVAASYIIFTFPPHIPLEVYIQVMPDMVNVTNDTNDIFSFYKEELANENTNHISILSQLHQCSKLESMQALVEMTVQGHRRTKEVLASHAEAYDCYMKGYLPGFADFHILANERYKLDELRLDQS